MHLLRQIFVTMVSISRFRQQDAGFFERFPIRGHDESQTLRARQRRALQITHRRCEGEWCVVEQSERCTRCIRRTQRAAWKYPHATHERHLFVTPSEQHFDITPYLTQQKNRRCIARFGGGADRYRAGHEGGQAS